ncbi:MAG: hypothetical protein HWN68_15690 [Desulfobacterales bacterium]|nr:hypothetical protein [Desulfobacterales bacterium]
MPNALGEGKLGYLKGEKLGYKPEMEIDRSSMLPNNRKIYIEEFGEGVKKA